MNEIVKDIIDTIERELKNDETSSIEYVCEDGTVIHTDVGYVYEWFNEYREVLRRKYSK